MGRHTGQSIPYPVRLPYWDKLGAIGNFEFLIFDPEACSRGGAGFSERRSGGAHASATLSLTRLLLLPFLNPNGSSALHAAPPQVKR